MLAPVGGGTAVTQRVSVLRRQHEAEVGQDLSRRRFVIAVGIALLLTGIVYVLVLWGPWEALNPLRKTAFEDNFYDLQARAIFHGHLYLRNGAIGIEAFVHDGRQYTYFGLFPSLLRMPVLIFTSQLDGKLTPSSMLLAWLVTGVVGSLLLWRVRLLVRGRTVMGRAEAASFGVLVATIMAGTVLIYLAATPYVFDEDLAWSVALTVAATFALLGVVESPSWRRVVGAGALILAANLDRVTTGVACVLGAVLIALWFRFRRNGAEEDRRWLWPLLAAGLVPLAAGFAVNWAKFGVPFGLPVTHQVWTSVNAYRRQFLAANGFSEVGPQFIPSNLLAYFRPDGLRLTAVFPFITLPAAPAHAVSGVLFDRRYRTASMPASMLLLFLLSCWGVITAFRPRPQSAARMAGIRILVLATASAGGALLLWGYIANRYLADFVPFLALAGAVGLAGVWTAVEGRHRSGRSVRNAGRVALTLVTAIGLFTIATNVAIAVEPNEEWSGTQLVNYVRAQKAVSDLTGHPLSGRVQEGSSLPAWAPAGQLFVVGSCAGLYLSDGEDYSTVPLQQFQRKTWMAVERGAPFQHVFDLTFGAGTVPSVDLVRVGASVLSVRGQSTNRGHRLDVRFNWRDPRYSGLGASILVSRGSTLRVTVITDTQNHLVEVSTGGAIYLERPLSGSGRVTVPAHVRSFVGPPPISVTDVTNSAPRPSLCRSLTRAGAR